MTIVNNVQRFYEENPFPDWSVIKYYKELFKRMVIPEKNPKGRCLVVGCGTLQPLNLLMIGQCEEYTFVDLSQPSLAIAKSCVSDSDKHKWWCGNILDFKSEDKYDLIFCTNMLHHNENPKQILEKIQTLAAPKAKLSTMVYNKQSELRAGIRSIASTGYERGFDQTEWEEFLESEKKSNTGVRNWLECYNEVVLNTWAHPYYSEYTHEELYDLCYHSGFEIVKSKLDCYDTQIDAVGVLR